jgi:hypothetical protein
MSPQHELGRILVRPVVRIFAILMMFSVTAGTQAADDRGPNVLGKQQVQAMFKAEAPYIANGRATCPSAKRRYLAGLPPGYRFAVRKHLSEASSGPVSHRMESVYVDVDAVKDGKIYGRIDSDVDYLRSFHRDQRISFPESELEDWAIFHPDGSVEGDFVGKFLRKAKSAYTNDLALSSDDVARIKLVCHEAIGRPLQDAFLWRELEPFVRSESDFFKPMTTGAGEYCSGAFRLRDDTEVLYTYLHIPPKGNGRDDLTPDLRRKGDNRIEGMSLIRHGKTILSEGHLDRDSVDKYLRHRDSRESKPAR